MNPFAILAAFDFLPEIEDKIKVWDRVLGRIDAPPEPIIYKVGNVIIQDDHPPQRTEMPPPPPPPPRVFTRDPMLAALWRSDGDRCKKQRLPDNAVRIRKNIVSILSLCHGRHVLILQLRRMNGIGLALSNLLFSQKIKKLSFEQTDKALTLAPIGIQVHAGFDLEDMMTRYASLPVSLFILP